MNIKDIRTRKGLTQAEVASALGVSSVAVSYTHLVFTNVKLCSLSVARMSVLSPIFTSQSASKIVCIAALSVMRQETGVSIVSVSYTHLDVYKRQVRGRSSSNRQGQTAHAPAPCGRIPVCSYPKHR